MTKATMILEGGATRGLFSAGALDYLMEQDNYFTDVIGVSMGACNAIDYASKQIGRTKDCIIHNDKETNYYYKPIEMIRKKSLMDMDLIFDTFPKEIYPFDFETYSKSEMHCELVVTNCITGKAQYISEKKDFDRLMQVTRASCSMPIVSKMTDLDGMPYLDGGLADSIPIKRAMKFGNKKIFIILTRNDGYRKEPNTKALAKVYKKMYKDYPALVNTLLARNNHYNKTIEKIEEYERKGYIFVIRPEIPTISRVEKDVDKMQEFYQHGYEMMDEKYQALTEYLEK
ncbi:MAG: patatin family protein [Suipraeoptans sp.]